MTRSWVWYAVVLGFVLLIPLSACQSALETTTTTAASAQPPAGWLKYAGGGAEIYLPQYFDWNMKDPTTVSSLRLLGAPGLEQFMNRDEPIVVFASANMAPGNGFSFVTAAPGSPALAKLSLKEYVDQIKYEGSRLTSRSDLTIDGRKTTRLVIEGDSLSVVAFVVTAPAGYWVINYAVPSSELPARLSDLDASAATFRILP